MPSRKPGDLNFVKPERIRVRLWFDLHGNMAKSFDGLDDAGELAWSYELARAVGDVRRSQRRSG